MTRIFRCPACGKITLFTAIDSEIYDKPAWQCSLCLTSVQTAQTTLQEAHQ